MQAHPDPGRVRSNCAKILASRAFADAPRLSQFLQYALNLTLDGQGDSIKEYAIGVQVFERPENFDPKIDSIVRMQAGRLKLLEVSGPCHLQRAQRKRR